jgi:hypothetical protein
MPMGAQPEKRLHANRQFGLFSNKGDKKTSLRRSHYVAGEESPIKKQFHFGHLASPKVVTQPNILHPYGFSENDENCFSREWHKAGRLLRVPKVVMLSTLPAWHLLWKECSIMIPRQVSFTWNAMPISESNPTANWYQFDQWNGNLANEWLSSNGGPVESPWWKMHRDLWDVFEEAAEMLISDRKDPIFCFLPKWIPKSVTMKMREKVGNWYRPNPEREWWQAILPPYFNDVEVRSTVLYPDVESGANLTANSWQGAPVLAAPRCFFGGDVLHMYFGHWATRTSINGRDLFAYQSWPYFPEGIHLGSTIFSPGYLGAALPSFQGARFPWRWNGYPYGYMESDLTGWYAESVASSVNQFKANYWQYRDWHTDIIPYNFSWEEDVNTSAIYINRRKTTEMRFYFGDNDCCDPGCGTICGFCALLGCDGVDTFFRHREDGLASEGTGLKTGELTTTFVSMPELNRAVGETLRPVQMRFNEYYGSIEQGTMNFFANMIASHGLADYGFRLLPDGAKKFLSATAIVEHVKLHFEQQERNKGRRT